LHRYVLIGLECGVEVFVGGGVVGGGGGTFFLCPSSSQWVSFKFPICSLSSQYVPQVSNVFPRVFPIAPCFNHIHCAQSPPLLTYIGGPKGEALHLLIESSILGEPS